MQYGDELFPQPTFSSADGLAIARASIDDGIFQGTQGGAVCIVRNPPTFTAGQVIDYCVTFDSPIEGAAVIISIGSGQDEIGPAANGSHIGQFTMGPNPQARIRMDAQDSSTRITGLSIREVLP